MGEKGFLDLRDLETIEEPSDTAEVIGLDEDGTVVGKIPMASLKTKGGVFPIYGHYNDWYTEDVNKRVYLSAMPSEIAEKLSEGNAPLMMRYGYCTSSNVFEYTYFTLNGKEEDFTFEIILNEAQKVRLRDYGHINLIYDKSWFLTENVADVTIDDTLYENVPSSGKDIPDYNTETSYPFRINFMSPIWEGLGIDFSWYSDAPAPTTIKFSGHGITNGMPISVIENDEYKVACLVNGIFCEYAGYASGSMWVDGEIVEIETDASSGCFDGDTKILVALDGTTRPIRDLRKGDPVVYWDGEKLVEGIVTDKFNHVGYDLMATVKTANREATFTVRHPVLTTEGYKNIKGIMEDPDIPAPPLPQLKVGDKLVTVDGEEEITEITKIIFRNDMFSLTTGGAFIANGFIAKDSIRTRPEMR